MFTCKFFLFGNNISTIIKPILSRCKLINLNWIWNNEWYSYLLNIIINNYNLVKYNTLFNKYWIDSIINYIINNWVNNSSWFSMLIFIIYNIPIGNLHENYLYRLFDTLYEHIYYNKFKA